MKIGELAKMTHCSVETIRYYEREGLLPTPTRSEGNYRSYTMKHADRLRFIRNCRALDMAQDEIRALLAMMDQGSGDCGSVNDLVASHLEHVNLRINELMDLRQQLTDLRHRCQGLEPVGSCGIVQGLAAMSPESKSRTSHLS